MSEDTWPFTGREAPLAAVRAALTHGTGAVVAGEAGVGKSWLIGAAVGGLTGYAVVRAVGTQAAASIPFGAFGHVLAGRPDTGGNLLQDAAEQIRAAAGPCQPLVTVDDGQWLDPASAALVHHLALHHRIRVLVAVRTEEPVPEPVTVLWKDDLLPRIDLAPMTAVELREVLAAALRGPVEGGTVYRLAHASQGNLLYLREVVRAGRNNGHLSQMDGVWRWRGELSLTARLRELVEARIGDLDPAARRLLELVAFGEPLGARPLMDLTSPDAVESAEDRGLLSVVDDGRRRQVRLGHPLYGEVVRGWCGSLRARRRLHELAGAVEATGLRRREDVLRVAMWRLDSGTVTDPRHLRAAANLAWARHDPRLAARLAQAAVDAGGGVEAAALLGQVLMVTGRTDEAAAVLRNVTMEGASDHERTQHAISLGINLAWAGADGQACQLLDDAAAAVTDPELLHEILIYRGLADFFAGRPVGAERTLIRLSRLGTATAHGRAYESTLRAWVSAYSGQTRRSRAVVEAALAEADRWRDGAPHAMPTLLDAACAAAVFAGDLAAAASAAEAGLALVDTPGGADLSASAFGAHRSVVSRLRGEAAEAVRWCQEDLGRLRARTPYLGRCLGELAHAAALTGDTATARRALAEAEPLARRWAFTHQPVLQSEAWLAATEGDLDAAVRAAHVAADAAEKHGLTGYLMFALHDLVRLGASRLAADRLAALADRMDGPLVELCARHGRAAAGGDGAGLRSVSEDFEKLGLALFAAEAAAQAAIAFRRAGRQASSRSAESRAWLLAQRCGGARTPALVELAAPELTPRQREIAQLAAAGLSNREIAERLTLSVRTAANHLQAVYDRLGVNCRAEVALILRELQRTGG
jgi:DNA-binding CsgD family transcriptional regulator